MNNTSLKLDLKKLKRELSGTLISPRLNVVRRNTVECLDLNQISPPISQVRNIPEKLSQKKTLNRSRSNSLV